MTEVRMNISNKGVSKQIILKEEQIVRVKGLKIGDKLKGDDFGLAGYEMELRGGTDKDGFPMRRDVHGAIRKRIILSSGTGYKPKEKGIRRRKMVHGTIFDDTIAQINVAITKEGSKKFETLLAKPTEEKKE